MVDLGIDIWQGALPENDIPKLQKQLNGRMTLMGGIDAAIVDRADSTEEEIRKEVRRACQSYGPGGVISFRVSLMAVQDACISMWTRSLMTRSINTTKKFMVFNQTSNKQGK